MHQPTQLNENDKMIYINIPKYTIKPKAKKEKMNRRRSFDASRRYGKKMSSFFLPK
jgi:hypothetical protein